MKEAAASLPVSIPPFRIISKGAKKTVKKKKARETDIPFEKWIMPPQPEEYIKSRRHDFF